MVNEILVSSINTVHGAIRHNLVKALGAAEDAEECHTDISTLLTNACGRLERLLSFFNKTWMTREADKATSSELYTVTTYCLHTALSELDIANSLLFAICKDAEDEEFDDEGKKIKKKKGKKGKKSGGGTGNPLANSVSLSQEIDELRRLKAKRSRLKGAANPALAAQIATLEASHVGQAGFDQGENEGYVNM